MSRRVSYSSRNLHSKGLLTFQFSTSYIKSLAAGTYSLQFVTSENVTHTMKLVVAEDGTYTVSY